MRIHAILPLLALLAGCAVAPTPKYTVADCVSIPQTAVNAQGLTLRMSPDLRAYSNPLVFHKDGTVTVYRALSYYAPLEVILERALDDASVFNPAAQGILRVTVRDFCVDATGETPEATVTLEIAPEGRTVSMSATLPADYTPAHVRATLGDLLFKTYAKALQDLPRAPAH